MSLLLDALKKAEKAKEEAQRRASEGTPAPAAPAALKVESYEPPASSKHVMRRSELPDISASIEILSDDIAPKVPAAEPPRPSAASQPAGIGQKAQAGARDGTEASLQRAAARKVFEAKFKESNPRMPFYVTMGVLGVFALATVGYFWYQLRPPAPLVSADPKPVASAPATAAPAPAPAASTAGGPIAGLPGSAASIPGLASGAPANPPISAATATATARAPEAAPVADPAPRTVAPERRAARTVPAPERAAAPAVRAAPQIHPKVESAYLAYMSGDVSAARADYQQALREDPSNRDAQLGLAAVDARSGRYEAAESAYVRLLQVDPRDAHAQAGLIALRSGRVDPLVAESRVKTLLAADPGSHVLYFTLGNQLAQQERWAEAQQQYFKAFAAEPENPDFAYNLAVSLDHMRQPKLAMEYYQRALALTSKRGASFDAASVQQRIAQLGK